MGSSPVRVADFVFVPKTRDNNDNDLKVAHLCRGSSSTIPGQIGSLEMLVFQRRGENWSTWRKTSCSKGENHQ